MLRSLGLVAFVACLAACGGNSDIGPNEDGICRDVGFCNESVDACGCDTSCTRIDNAYSCKVSCGTTADCTGTKEPITGAAFTECVQAQGENSQSRAAMYCR